MGIVRGGFRIPSEKGMGGKYGLRKKVAKMYSYSMHPLETVPQVCYRVCLSVRALRIMYWMCKIYVCGVCVYCVCVEFVYIVCVESCVYFVCVWGVCLCGVQVHLFSFGDA